MKSGFTAKSVIGCFAIVLALYAGCFYGMEFLRHRKGAWEVNFLADAAGNPSVVVYQPRLNISSVEIIFAGEQAPATNVSQRVAFDRPLRPVPFGKVIYEDLTSLPGVVTFDLFGHEIELLPRVLIVNKREVPWKSDSTVELSATNKPAHPPKSPQEGRRPPGARPTAP